MVCIQFSCVVSKYKRCRWVSVPFPGQSGSDRRKTTSSPNGSNKETNDAALYRGVGGVQGLKMQGETLSASSFCHP